MRILFINYTRAKISKKRNQATIDYLADKFKNNKILKSKISRNIEIEDISIVFVSVKQSRFVNGKFRKKDYATDVLSFTADENGMGLGEIVMCPKVLEKQAKSNGHSFNSELQLMLIHGFLHLLGYDHEKSLKDERQMMKIQNELQVALTKRF